MNGGQKVSGISNPIAEFTIPWELSRALERDLTPRSGVSLPVALVIAWNGAI
jgi:hypothetical protein